MKITKLENGNFFVVTDDVTSDMRPIQGECRLNGFNELQTVWTGDLSFVPPLRVKLGRESYRQVRDLKVRESIVF